jgi:prepilin-type N-terminal cleavage/methylation domain-containing protein
VQPRTPVGVQGIGLCPSRAGRGRRGFSLIELIVVLAVVTMLTGLLMPALRGVRESANKMVCASNQRQVGAGITIWATNHGDRLPPSYFGSKDVMTPQEMMALTRGPDTVTGRQWEGLGWLIHGCCIDTPECLYCPSCRGDHPMTRYRDPLMWTSPETIYSNYHYSGDYDVKNDRNRTIANSPEEILLSDGLRTFRDFNHGIGGNLLRGDGSVFWIQDESGAIQKALPSDTLDPKQQGVVYGAVWSILYNSD